MSKSLVYIALGGNIGDTRSIFIEAINKLKKLGDDLKVSKWYETEPVSPIPQRNYLNGCVSFLTELTPYALFQSLEKIEKELGKKEKAKEAPRIIDLDLIFYGEETFESEGLQIPHPRFKERLFVLKPLADLTEKVGPYNIHDMLRSLEGCEHAND